MNKQVKFWSTTGFIVIGIVVGVILTSQLDLTPKGFASKHESAPVLGAETAPSQEVLQMQNTSKAFVAVSKEVLPTVVSISTSKIVESSGENPFGPLFRDFFGREYRSQPQRQRQTGLGSGVIVSKEGYILTNHHVISNADDIQVTLHDNRVFEAELVGTDPLTEVAVIKIDGDDLPVARLGESENMEIGEWVLAVGNPLGLTSTVTAGIVSATGRAINIIQDPDRNETGGSYAIENFIQTDAAINPGNSGGALVNLKGEVIGINTAIASRTGGYQGYGFAVPIDLASKIMEDLIDKGFVVRAYLGISMRPVDEPVARRFGLDRPRGVYVEQVVSGSPAEKGGLEEFDVILELDGKEVNQSNEIQNYIALKDPGDAIRLKVWRNKKEIKITAKLGQRETGVDKAQDEDGNEMPELGLQVQALNDELRSRLDAYENDEGVLVTQVEPYSAAHDAGIRRGQLITRIEDTDITSVSQFRKEIRGFKKGQVVIFYLKAGNNDFHAFVEIP